jgi:hypothetical protein
LGGSQYDDSQRGGRPQWLWIDADRESEGDILRSIERDAADEDKPFVEQDFLTVLADGHVRLSDMFDSAVDTTLIWDALNLEVFWQFHRAGL